MNKPFRHQETVEQQLLGIGVTRFDIQVRSSRGHVVEQRDELFITQVKDILDWLYDKNQKGNAILIRPHGEHGMALVSGLDHQQVEAARVKGFEPAVQIEYTADRFQLWLKHDRKLDAATAEQVNRYIAGELGGDESASCWNGYGYLAGFTLTQDGDSFPVQLAAHGGEVYTQAKAVCDRFA